MKKRTLIEENIYLKPNGKFVAVTNLPFVDAKGRRLHRKQERTFSVIEEARRWITESKEINLNFNVRTLGDVMRVVQPEKSRLKNWKSIRKYWTRAQRFFGEGCPLVEINRARIGLYRAWLYDQPNEIRKKNGGLSKVTINRHISELLTLLRYAVDEGYLGRVPKVRLENESGHVRDLPISFDDFLRMVDRAPEPHAAIFWLAVNTGARPSDVFRMRRTRFVSSGQRPYFVVHNSKNQRDYIEVPALAETVGAIKRYRSEYFNGTEFLIVNPRTNRPFTDIQKTINTVCRASSIPRITLYHLKHLATTVLLDITDGNVDLVQRVVGWSNTEMMRRYYGHLQQRHLTAFSQFDAMVADRRRVVNGGHVPSDVTPKSNKLVEFEVTHRK